VKKEPPCFECPKYKLHPVWTGTFGLLPSNVRVVQLYRQASVDERAGDCGFLHATTTPERIRAVLDENAHEFPTWLARREAFDLIWLIGQFATGVRGKREEAERKRQMEEMEAKRKRK
jgi:hypothetical protein